MATEREKKELDEELRNYQNYLEKKANIERTVSKDDMIKGLKPMCKKLIYTTEDIQELVANIKQKNNIDLDNLETKIRYLLYILDAVSNHIQNLERCH